MRSNLSANPLRRRQLDKQLKTLQPFVRTPRPRKGWVREIRDALGMTSLQLAQRVGVSQPTIAKLERSEEMETIALKSLRKLAEAMECTLVYALVPNDSLEATLMRQAEIRAEEQLQRVEHSMRLEAQGRLPDEVESERRELAQEMIRTLSREIWEVGK